MIVSSEANPSVSPESVTAAVRELAYLSTPEWDEDRGAATAYLSHPLTTSTVSGATHLGHLVTRLGLGAIRDLLESAIPGADGTVYLVNEDGAVFASSMGAAGRLRLSEENLTRLSENLGGTTEYRTQTGEVVLGTMHAVPGVTWRVVAEVDQAVAFASITRLRNLTAVIVLGLAALMGTLAYMLSQIVVRPLTRLTEGAEVVASGDLSVDLPVTGGGEVGSLTEVFNDMVRRLRESRRELDVLNAELLVSNEELARLSVTDELTQLVNRRRAQEVLADEIERATRTGVSMSLLMLDVDHFKRYNDTWGHPEGDVVLQGVAKALRQATRGIDTVARYGGEEFMVILPECDAEGAMEAGIRILDRLTRDEYQGGAVTMSIGVAVSPEHTSEGDALVATADGALYQAKERGRNRVVLADGVALPEGSQYSAEMAPEESDSDGRSGAVESSGTSGKRSRRERKRSTPVTA